MSITEIITGRSHLETGQMGFVGNLGLDVLGRTFLLFFHSFMVWFIEQLSQKYSTTAHCHCGDQSKHNGLLPLGFGHEHCAAHGRATPHTVVRPTDERARGARGTHSSARTAARPINSSLLADLVDILTKSAGNYRG